MDKVGDVCNIQILLFKQDLVKFNKAVPLLVGAFRMKRTKFAPFVVLDQEHRPDDKGKHVRKGASISSQSGLSKVTKSSLGPIPM